MTTRFFGAPVKRNEDRKLLTGQALFIDDVELPGMLHAAFLRSQVAHARINRIDVSRRCSGPGWSRSILLPISGPTGSTGHCWCRRRRSPASSSTSARRCRWQGQGSPRRRAAGDRRRGERYIAEDALDDIVVELDVLPGGGRYRGRR